MIPFPTISKLARPSGWSSLAGSPSAEASDWLRRRSPAALALATMIGVAFLSLACGTLFPISRHAPTRLSDMFLVLALVLAIATLILGDRLSDRALLALATAAVLINTILVSAARTRVGAVADAICYMWLTVYVAAFFPQATRWFMGLVLVALTGALLETGLPNMESAWFLVAITTVAAGTIVGRLSRGARRQLATDALTGVLNRPGLHEAVDRVWARARRRGDAQMTVAVIDLDGFKQINDSAGHAAGDRLLAETAAAWRDRLRHEDLLARIGGDEFVMVLPGTSLEEAHAMLERLRPHSPVEWSAGVAQWPIGASLHDVLALADELLYAAKAPAEASADPARGGSLEAV